MNMFARFDENPAMTLRVIKETKRYGRTDSLKTVYPLQTKFAGGIITEYMGKFMRFLIPVQDLPQSHLWKCEKVKYSNSDFFNKFSEYVWTYKLFKTYLMMFKPRAMGR